MMDQFQNKKIDNSGPNFGFREAKRREKEIIHSMKKPTLGKNRLYGFHSWEGKPQGKNSVKLNDVLLDQSTYSPILVKKLVDRGISVIYLGASAKQKEILEYAAVNRGVVLITNNRDLDEQLPHGKSMLLRFANSIEEKSQVIYGFAKESPIPEFEKQSPSKEDISLVPEQKKVVAPTWKGDVPYAESDIVGTNIVVSSGRPGHSPKLVDQNTVDYSAIDPPAILKLTSGNLLTKVDMEGVWMAKTVIASLHNAKTYLKKSTGVILSIGAGPTDPIARSFQGVSGVYTISLDKSAIHLNFLKEKIGGDEKDHGFIVADARYLPFKDGSIDTATSTYLFDKFDGKSLALSLLEARRVSTRKVYLELAPSQGNKKSDSLRFFMDLCGLKNPKSLHQRVSFSNGNSARSYIFTGEPIGKPFNEELIREASTTKSAKSEGALKMERMLEADHQKYHSMNRYFELIAEFLHNYVEQTRERKDPTGKFAYGLMLSAINNGQLRVSFNPALGPSSEHIDTTELKEILDSGTIQYTMKETKKGAIEIAITGIPAPTAWMLRLVQTAPKNLMDATRHISMESIFSGADTDELMKTLDEKGYWDYDTGPKLENSTIVFGISRLEKTPESWG